MKLCYENKEYVLENHVSEIDEAIGTLEEIYDHKQHIDDATKFICIMIAIMSPDLQKSFEDYWTYEMNFAIFQMFHKKARQERYEIIKAFMECKLKEWEYGCAHVKRHIERLKKLNVHFEKDLAIDMVLKSLLSSYDQFILTCHLNNTKTTLIELHSLLQTVDAGMKKSHSNSFASAPNHGYPSR